MNRNALALAAAATLAFAVQTALAQDKPKPPPIWKQGQPEKMKDSKLAPLPGRMTETPASEIPIAKLMFPKEYQNTMFIARKGSWNRTDKIGFDVVNVRPSADGKRRA